MSETRWIPVKEKLPKPFENVIVLIHESEWIYPEWGVVYPEKRYVTNGYRFQSEDGYVRWKFTNSRMLSFEETANEEFGDDRTVPYSVVEAWMPLPKPPAFDGK